MFFRKSPPQAGVKFIICGLGNPGIRYENTRHNCGFMVIDDLAKKYFAPVKKLRFKSLTGEAVINGQKCLLMKPSTFMNKSGEAVAEAMRFYKLNPAQVLIICDDVNFEVGVIRIRARGSDGGQNGLKNIIMLGNSDEFPRVRVGVGGKPHPDYDMANWVLSAFLKAEASALEFALANAVGAAEMFTDGDLNGAMNRFNGVKPST
ncbi:MAG: aminoacyl-tRNA hydrolase [Oscillospiraceae bacterium]|nr:aminoacyl-tRNA hydrolase [Oscillospiraceae bacterium]